MPGADPGILDMGFKFAEWGLIRPFYQYFLTLEIPHEIIWTLRRMWVVGVCGGRGGLRRSGVGEEGRPGQLINLLN